MFTPPTPEKLFQKRLGYSFRHKEELAQALTHPSLRNERGQENTPDNQRLEFLGDAVLGLITAECLFAMQTRMDEGAMTKYRSMLTNRNTLAALGEFWCLGPLLRLGRGEETSGGARRDSNLADAVEAVLGAVYRDGGMKAAQKVFDIHFRPRLEAFMREGADADNPKGALQEFTQRHWQRSPIYRIVEEQGPSHGREYVAAVYWGDLEIARGRAGNKRGAEARAAAAALPVMSARLTSDNATQAPCGGITSS
jgi:ribonuclease-3